MGMELEYNCLMASFFTHYIYLNGKKIKIPHKIFDKENLKGCTFASIRQKLGNLLPDDSLFCLEGGIEPQESKEDEKECDIVRYILSIGIHLYSPSLDKNEGNSSYKKETFPDSLKLLGKEGKYDVFEYPQKKDELNYYNIIILGKRDIWLINLFLNFLFDVKYDDNYRVVLAGLNLKDEKENIIETYYITSKKGNFKFISIKIDTGCSDKQDDLKQIIEMLNKEQKINLILLWNASFGGCNEDKISCFKKINMAKDEDKNGIFFIEPNFVYLLFKYYYCMNKLDPQGNNNDKTKQGELNLDFMKEINSQLLEETDNLFSSSMIYPKGVFTSNKELSKIAYEQAMEGYSKLYDKIIKSENNVLNLSNIKSYLEHLLKLIEPLEKIKKEISQKKEDYKKKKQDVKNLEQKGDDEISVQTQELKKIIEDYNKDICDFEEKEKMDNIKKDLKINNLLLYEEMIIIVFSVYFDEYRDTFFDEKEKVESHDSSCMIL